MDSRRLCKSCFIVFFLVLANEVRAQESGQVLDITKLGAVGDGTSDDSKAFQDAFASACKYTGGRSTILIPKRTFMAKSLEFEGPCNGPIEFRLQGTVKATAGATGERAWITFRRIDGLAITGRGTIDGSGETAWDHNDCDKNSKCKFPSSSFFMGSLTNSEVRGISFLNSKGFHMSLFNCKNMEFKGIRITAPADSPNTDGIHMSESEDVRILNSIIGTGDDCISLGHGNKNILVEGVKCGPGHGISIGSLGKYDKETDVSGITVRDCSLAGTDNGLRIKTWASAIKLSVYNITYENIIMKGVSNPILIDQEYCPSSHCDNSKPSSVEIKNVLFTNVRGSSKSQTAVSLLCSRKYPCSDIKLRDIDLTYQDSNGPAEASCSNVSGSASGIQNPKACV